MGNRAVITTDGKSLGIYLHWNGGRDSVEAFLLYCKIKDYRCPEDDNYGWARLCQVISNYFRGGCSVGIDKLENLDTDNGDNGTYVIRNWEIVGREFNNGEQNEYDKWEFVVGINEQMPEEDRLTEEELKKKFNEYTKESN